RSERPRRCASRAGFRARGGPAQREALHRVELLAALLQAADLDLEAVGPEAQPQVVEEAQRRTLERVVRMAAPRALSERRPRPAPAPRDEEGLAGALEPLVA